MSTVKLRIFHDVALAGAAAQLVLAGGYDAAELARARSSSPAAAITVDDRPDGRVRLGSENPTMAGADVLECTWGLEARLSSGGLQAASTTENGQWAGFVKGAFFLLSRRWIYPSEMTGAEAL